MMLSGSTTGKATAALAGQVCVGSAARMCAWLQILIQSVPPRQEVVAQQSLGAGRALHASTCSTAHLYCCSSHLVGVDERGPEAPTFLYLLRWLLTAGSCVVLMTMLSRVPTAGVHAWRGATTHACSRSTPLPTSAGAPTGCDASKVAPAALCIALVSACVSYKHPLQQRSTAGVCAHISKALLALLRFCMLSAFCPCCCPLATLQVQRVQDRPQVAHTGGGGCRQRPVHVRRQGLRQRS
jgi:hypothetical protein